MNYINKANELVEYASKYQNEIQNEGFKDQFQHVVGLLKSIDGNRTIFVLLLMAQSDKNSILSAFSQKIISRVGIFIYSAKLDGYIEEAAIVYKMHQSIQLLNSLEVPSTAKTSHRIFNSILKGELTRASGSDFEAPKELIINYQEDSLQRQGEKYESMAAHCSYSLNFMRNSLLLAMYCYSQSQGGAASANKIRNARIESCLKAIDIPIKPICAKKYLFSALKTFEIPFSVTHPRFIEVMEDFSKTVNASPNDSTIVSCYNKWLNELRKPIT